MTKFLTDQARVSGSFPVVINGVLTTLTEGQNFTDSASLLSALDGAGISYDTAKLDATTGTASGRYRINGTGATVTVGVNGTFADFAVNAWFTPTAAQLEALQRAPYLVLEAEYTDQTPSAFSFTDVTDVATSSTQTSNTITVAGLGTGVSVAVSITGGTYSKNGGSYVSSAGTAINGDTFAVRHTASGSAATAVNTVLTIGGVSDTFTSTTVSVTPGPELVTNGTFSADTDWTKTGPDASPTISGGLLHFTDGSNASTQTAKQTLAGGSTPAGTYSYSIDVSNDAGAGPSLLIRMYDAGNVIKGSKTISLTGSSATFTGTFTTSAACTQVGLVCDSLSFDVDNFSLKLLS